MLFICSLKLLSILASDLTFYAYILTSFFNELSICCKKDSGKGKTIHSWTQLKILHCRYLFSLIFLRSFAFPEPEVI